MDWSRAWRHFATTQRESQKLFSPEIMERLQAVIAEGEATHRGEVRLIIESSLPFRKIRRGMTTRQRALDLFGTFRVWDTEENNGVLLYINIADHKLEVIADRAAARGIGDPHWQSVCSLAQQAFKAGDFERGVAEALTAIHRALATVFPADARSAENELPDAPVMM